MHNRIYHERKNTLRDARLSPLHCCQQIAVPESTNVNSRGQRPRCWKYPFGVNPFPKELLRQKGSTFFAKGRGARLAERQLVTVCAI
jgi:hypothetical protein